MASKFSRKAQDPRAWAEARLAEEPAVTRGGIRLQKELQAEARKILAEIKPEDEPWRPYYASRADYMAARKESREWGREHARKPMSEWRPSSGPRETKAYWDAYVQDWNWRTKGESRGTPWHRYYVTQIIRAMTEAEYDAAYPGAYE